jgi:hypothetical protein
LLTLLARVHLLAAGMLELPIKTTMPGTLLRFSEPDARDRLLDDDVTSVTAAQFEASFRVTGKLGYGAYSDVYSCVHQGAPKALKVLRPGEEAANSARTPSAASTHCISRSSNASSDWRCAPALAVFLVTVPDHDPQGEASLTATTSVSPSPSPLAHHRLRPGLWRLLA